MIARIAEWGRRIGYLVNRGKYRRGERWGYEVKGPAARGRRAYSAWQTAGVRRASAVWSAGRNAVSARKSAARPPRSSK